jgi:hypothetical protein
MREEKGDVTAMSSDQTHHQQGEQQGDASAPPGPLLTDGRQSQAALDIARGASRCLLAHGFARLPEFTLPDGRRADLIALAHNGDIWIIEIKSSIEDFRADQKWPDYRAYCDQLYFAVAPDFPLDILPPETGIVVADRYTGEIVRPAPEHKLAAARRKALTLGIARAASFRLHTLFDPELRLECQ